MNNNFGYIDIILLAMIAGFIFLRLRGILGKRTGFEGKAPRQFDEILKNVETNEKKNKFESFDDKAKNDFLNGAKIGNNCLIGANSLITEGMEIPDNSLDMGSPAKIKKELDPSMKDILIGSATHYVENYIRFKKDLMEQKI